MRSASPAAASITASDRREAGCTDNVIVVHTLAHATGALRAAAHTGRPIALLSAPDAGIYAGPGWFAALIAAARAAAPVVHASAWLDCGNEAGAALAAIRARVEGVIFTGRLDIVRRLAEVAAQHSVRFGCARPLAGLDLGSDFFASEAASEAVCAAFLEHLA